MRSATTSPSSDVTKSLFKVDGPTTTTAKMIYMSIPTAATGAKGAPSA